MADCKDCIFYEFIEKHGGYCHHEKTYVDGRYNCSGAKKTRRKLSI